MSTLRFHRQAGFSLIELSVSLVVMGVIGLMLWRWTAATQEPATLQTMQKELGEAQAAVEGFVLARHRLPCPAADAAGNEACGSASAVLLPWRTLGLSSDKGALHYGVNRGGGVDLAVEPAATIAPDLNIDFTGVPTLAVDASAAPDAATASTRVATLIAAAAARRTAANGLDWCRVVRALAGNTAAAGVIAAGNITTNMPVAYILVHPGKNGQFDGNNQVPATGSWRYDLPGRAQDSLYDDLSLAVGPSDLAARIGCVARLSGAQSAAQSAFAQYDTTRLMQEYWSLRAFDITTKEADLDSAETGLVVADMKLAVAGANLATAVADTPDTEGILAAFMIPATAKLVAAGVAVGFAWDTRDEARLALTAARLKLLAASAYAAHSYETLALVLTQSIALDEKGLNP
jgi:prepilin-type N-terminal cleavage/methylation domain-containing protein